jgi:lipoyl(octanoyl) transferase
MPVIRRNLGMQPYLTVWQAMRDFTEKRRLDTMDEIWAVEHLPVYTLGLNGKREHLLSASDIPVIASDRGGQVTYHGPGQLVLYFLLDIKRLDLNVRALVNLLEQAMVKTLAGYDIQASAKAEAPGVYVDQRKIGSIGLRIRKNCSYHGLSLNNTVDLKPFADINPCGFQGLQMTRLADLGVSVDNAELAANLITFISQSITS